MTYSIEYFHAKVQATIEAWPVDVVADYAKIVELLIEHGPNLRLPHSRAFGGGLFELRPRGKSNIGRAFYCFLVGQRVVLLHAFIKKSQETPPQETKLARKRMKEIQND
ncbi:MAG: type II toxin-antitoxin system RelE/ParE family toxin [Gammaproteobacteria bacterium]|nr:type II toxin-antitoxin system RelE/ParE family toxin [Gammaproteobacteria bacterium]MBU1777068.1 type II toxin-antitoxin system RelE/ParE family toxin [Gammaproteobacteria bacterium]MBU1969139.1 type II toxin-antitoxin system RelE/ParE family toxin [Gammaproteobacteria bacterium]